VIRGRITPLLLLRECEVHGDRGYDGHRFAIQLCRLVAPLFHRVDCGLDKQRVTRNHFEVVDCSFFAYLGFKKHNTLNAPLLCQGRINRLDLRKQIGGLNVSTHANALRRRRWRWWRWWRWGCGGSL